MLNFVIYDIKKSRTFPNKFDQQNFIVNKNSFTIKWDQHVAQDLLQSHIFKANRIFYRIYDVKRKHLLSLCKFFLQISTILKNKIIQDRILKCKSEAFNKEWNIRNIRLKSDIFCDKNLSLRMKKIYFLERSKNM